MFKKSFKLIFDNEISINPKGKHVRDGLSAALITGKNLWIGCDERSTIERLTIGENYTFREHQSFDLNKLITLPAGTDCEVDIEGLGISNNKYLWVVGSHSLARKKPKKKDSPEKQISKLAKVKRDENRYILARIPIIFDEKSGNFELVNSATDPENTTATITAASLLSTETGNQLMDVLADDKHFKMFMKIPGKDNGFDIEGLAVKGERIFIGVRGPVLRGWAVILELQVEDLSPEQFHLKPFLDGTMYRKHFLHLEGMGIRDLRVVEDDLLILAGPTMDLDGTIAVYRWNNGTNQDREAIVHRSKLDRLFDVPHGTGKTSGMDKAEGMALYDDAHVLIVFDTPTDARKPDGNSVLGDLYEI